MSNAIRYDALLVRDLALELHAFLAGVRLTSAFLERDTLRVVLNTRAARRSDPEPPSLIWQLHPESGHLTAVPDGVEVGGRVQLAAPCTITAVHSPPDERVIVFELDAGDAPAGMARRIVIELVTNQWNALAIGADGRIAAVLRERKRRDLRAGAIYEPPPHSSRLGAESPVGRVEWHGTLHDVEPGERMGALQRGIAYTSALNAACIIGDADVSADPAALDRAYDRYLEIVWTAEREPVVLTIDNGSQPYSRPEPGAAMHTATLLDAFGHAATVAASAPATADAVERALDALARQLEAVNRRMERLKAQQTGAAADAEQLRRDADLMLAQLHRVPRGVAGVELDDFTGGTVAIPLDPTLSPAENANRLYDAARRRDRAAARVPVLLRAAARERARLERLIASVRTGAATPEQLAAIRPLRRTERDRSAPALPYREYRTSGGIEVRVGRGSRANDELTFRHSKPNDIWLHARDVAGAHVILRWDRAEENPPAAAITEAAVLAALHSRARTSGVVAVDWTRRKYVRKPRKAPPGLVIPERVRTVFVEPDAELEERLRAGAG